MNYVIEKAIALLLGSGRLLGKPFQERLFLVQTKIDKSDHFHSLCTYRLFFVPKSFHLFVHHSKNKNKKIKINKINMKLHCSVIPISPK